MHEGNTGEYYVGVRDAHPNLRATRTIRKTNCGWLPPLHPGSISFVRPQEMDERKGRPKPPNTSSASRRNRRSPNSPGAHNAPLTRPQVSRLLPASLRCSARDNGFQDQHPAGYTSLFSTDWIRTFARPPSFFRSDQTHLSFLRLSETGSFLCRHR